MKGFNVLLVATAALVLSGCTLAGQSPVGGASANLFQAPVLNAPAVAVAPSAASLSVASACAPVVDEPTFGVVRRSSGRKTVITLEK